MIPPRVYVSSCERRLHTDLNVNSGHGHASAAMQHHGHLSVRICPCSNISGVLDRLSADLRPGRSTFPTSVVWANQTLRAVETREILCKTQCLSRHFLRHKGVYVLHV